MLPLHIQSVMNHLFFPAHTATSVENSSEPNTGPHSQSPTNNEGNRGDLILWGICKMTDILFCGHSDCQSWCGIISFINPGEGYLFLRNGEWYKNRIWKTQAAWSHQYFGSQDSKNESGKFLGKCGSSETNFFTAMEEQFIFRNQLPLIDWSEQNIV